MKVLKWILIVIVVIVAGLAIAIMAIDPNFSVEREVTINKSKDVVFDYIKYVKNQDNYSVWQSMDPGMKKEYSGNDGTVGFIASWESENPDVGVGEQEITKIIDGERIDMRLRFKSPWESESDAYLAANAVNDSVTTVTWGFTGNMPRPMNLFLLFMDMEAAVGNDFQTGLDNLKGIVEAIPEPVIEPEVIEEATDVAEES